MKAQKKGFSAEIFTGSMADISFLLIIYFMVTMAFAATRGMDFALPEDKDQVTEIKQEESVDILVQPGGALQVDGRLMPLEELLPYVKSKLAQNPDKPVILRTDPSATYGHMITVFDELRKPALDNEHGFEIKTISIPTRREIETIWTMLGVG